MKRFLFLLLFLLISMNFCFADGDTAFLTGRIQSADFVKNANSFVIAIISNNKEEVKRLLELGADPNQKYTKVPVIYFASHLKYDEIMSLLLDYGADPNTTFFKESILKYSIFRKCSKCTQTLVLNGADVNKKTFGCSSPIELAVKVKDKESIDILLNAGAKTSKKTLKAIEKNNY